MVRSLWTAATGMAAQQNNVDTIANNLSNINTTGYKTEVAQFKSLLYQELQTRTTSANGDTKPIGAQVGLGVRNSSITSIFKQGSMIESDGPASFAIEGDGFFAIRDTDGETRYTRNGNFMWSTVEGGLALTNSEGCYVLDSQGRPIELTGNYAAGNVTITTDGTIQYPNANNNPESLGYRIGIFQFNNPAGLEKEGGSLYSETAASGEALNEATETGLTASVLHQGYLEGSNVQVADEMVNLIVAQRAYEMNSKAITTTDDMLALANQLKR